MFETLNPMIPLVKEEGISWPLTLDGESITHWLNPINVWEVGWYEILCSTFSFGSHNGYAELLSIFLVHFLALEFQDGWWSGRLETTPQTLIVSNDTNSAGATPLNLLMAIEPFIEPISTSSPFLSFLTVFFIKSTFFSHSLWRALFGLITFSHSFWRALFGLIPLVNFELNNCIVIALALWKDHIYGCTSPLPPETSLLSKLLSCLNEFIARLYFQQQETTFIEDQSLLHFGIPNLHSWWPENRHLWYAEYTRLLKMKIRKYLIWYEVIFFWMFEIENQWYHP